MPAGDCPTGTGDLLATWAARRGVAPWAGGRVFRPSIRAKGKKVGGRGSRQDQVTQVWAQQGKPTCEAEGQAAEAQRVMSR